MIISKSRDRRDRRETYHALTSCEAAGVQLDGQRLLALRAVLDRANTRQNNRKTEIRAGEIADALGLPLRNGRDILATFERLTEQKTTRRKTATA